MKVTRHTIVTTVSSRPIAHSVMRPRVPMRATFHTTAIAAAMTMMVASVVKLGARLNRGWISTGSRVIGGHQREQRTGVNPAIHQPTRLASPSSATGTCQAKGLGRRLGDNQDHRADANRDEQPAQNSAPPTLDMANPYREKSPAKTPTIKRT
jgi:hypothetical protein